MTKKAISRAVLSVLTGAMLLVPFMPTSASAGADEDRLNCVIQAIKQNTGIYWCFATKPPDR